MFLFQILEFRGDMRTNNMSKIILEKSAIIILKICLVNFQFSAFEIYISVNFQWISTILISKLKLICFLIKIKIFEISTKKPFVLLMTKQ